MYEHNAHMSADIAPIICLKRLLFVHLIVRNPCVVPSARITVYIVPVQGFFVFDSSHILQCYVTALSREVMCPHLEKGDTVVWSWATEITKKHRIDARRSRWEANRKKGWKPMWIQSEVGQRLHIVTTFPQVCVDDVLKVLIGWMMEANFKNSSSYPSRFSVKSYLLFCVKSSIRCP